MADELKVLAFSYIKTPSAVVGVIEPFSYINRMGRLCFNYKLSSEVALEDVWASDIVICIRGSEEIDLKLMQYANSQGKMAVYYMDDDLLNVNGIYAYNQKYYQNEKTKKNMLDIMEITNILWTNNKIIALKYNKKFKHILVTDAPAALLNVANTKNNSFDMSKNIESEENKERCLTIGFSGGIDHRDFFQTLLAKPFMSVYKKYSNRVRFEIIGFKPNHVNELPVNVCPYLTDYEQYRNFMLERKWDIAVAPLKDTSFNCCKYFNKFLEYGAIKAAGIYSEVYPFTEVVINRENGLLVENNPLSWERALIELIEQEAVRNKIVNKAYDMLKSEFCIEKVAEDIITKMQAYIQN